MNTTTQSTASAVSLSGSNLTGAPGNLTITAPSTDFQVSTTSATAGFGGTATMAYTTATLSATNFWVRFTPQSAGAKSGNVTISGGGLASAVNVAVSGTGVVAALTPSPTTLTGFTYPETLGPSSAQSFSLSGTNLTPAAGAITVTGSSSYEVSTSANSGFGASVSINYTGSALAATTVYVRLKSGLTAADYNNESIAISGGGATSAVTASGTVTAAPANPVISTVVVASPGSGTNVYNSNSVTINGTDLGTVTSVKVGTTTASIGTQSSTSITFTVPVGASGQVSVQNPAGSATSTETLSNLGYISTADGTYATPATWLGNAVPSSGATVTINNAVTAAAGATIGNLTVNAGKTLTVNSTFTVTLSGASTNNGTISTQGTLALSAALTNNGTLTVSGSNGSILINNNGNLLGTAPDYNQTASTLQFNNTLAPLTITGTEAYWPATLGPVTVNVLAGNAGVTIGSGVARTIPNLNLSSTLTITDPRGLTVNTALSVTNTAAAIAGNAPVYGGSSSLNINVNMTVGSGNLIWAAGTSALTDGVPYKVVIAGASSGLALTEDRTALTSVTVNGGTFTHNSNTLTVAPDATAAATAFQVSSGTYTQNGGNLLIGTTGGGNQAFSHSGGTTTIAAGTLTINGNLSVTTSGFTQSGGSIYVDGNGATASVATGTSLVSITTSSVTLSGGNLVIVDPHASSGASDYVLFYNNASALLATGTHTIELGDGTSTATGGTNGFKLNTWQGSQRFNFRNLRINNPSGTNRFVTAASGIGVNGNLTIVAGELSLPSQSLTLGGNLVNDGILTLGSLFNFGTTTGTNVAVTTGAQTVSGSGTFRNATTPTANFAGLVFNNTAASPSITFNIGSFSTSGNVTFTAGTGTVSTSNGDFTFTSSAATVTRTTTGYFLLGTGQMKKAFATGATTFIYHLGENTGTESYTPITLAVSANAAARNIGVKLTDDAHPSIGTAAHTITRYWSLTDDGSASITYLPTLQYVAEDVTGTQSLLRVATWNGSAWTDYATTVNTTTPSIVPTAAITAASSINGIELTGRTAGATKLTVFSVTPTNPTAGAPFSANVVALNASSSPTAVSANTNITLTVNGYGGTIGGTVTGTILAGTNNVTISGITLSSAGSNAQLTATATGGDALTDGLSAPFTVLAPASKLAFVNAPSSGTANQNLTSFTVEARRADNSVDATYTGLISLTSNGTLSGTITANAVAGVATFSAVQFTSFGTYTLTASGANQNSATNITPATSGSIVIAYGSGATDIFRSVTSGDWSLPATWEASPDNGANWYAATLAPGASTTGVSIRNGHTVTVSTAVTSQTITVATGATLTVNSGITFTLSDGTGTDLTVNGTVNNNGTVALQASGTTLIGSAGTWNNGGSITFAASTSTLTATGVFNQNTNGTVGTGGTVVVNGTWNHAQVNGSLPTATWADGSTVNVTGTTGTSPLGMAQSFYNFVWNTPNLLANNWGGTVPTVRNDFSILNTGTGQIRFANNPSYTLNVGGNFTIGSNGGANTVDVRFSNGTGTYILNIGGSYIQWGGAVDMMESLSTTPTTMNIGGDFNQQGGTFTISVSSGKGALNFQKANAIQKYRPNGTTLFNSTRTLTITVGTTGGSNTTLELGANVNVNSSNTDFVINTGSAIDMKGFVINSQSGNTVADFTLNSGATLSTAFATGVSVSGAQTAAVQVNGTRTFSTGANYVLNGSVAQTANLPTATISSLTINNPAGVTLTAARTLSGDLTLTSGSLELGTNALTLKGQVNRDGTTQTGTMNVATSTVTFNGTAAQSVPAAAFANAVAKTLVISNSNGVSLTGTAGLKLTTALTLTAGKLDIGSNDLTVVPGTITGASTTNYVKTSGTGALYQKGVSSTPVAFPVGNSTYNPVDLSSGTTQGWKVRVEDAVSNVTGIYAPNVAHAVSRQWDISPDSANPVPVPGVTATFYYNGSTDVGASFSNATDVQVWHYDAVGGWAKRGSPTTPATVGGLKAATVTGLTYFSPFAISNIDAPLPVTLVSFTGKRVNGVNELKWMTITESNNRGFEVERSLDGTTFTKVGFVASRAQGGNSTTDINYAYNDNVIAGSKWYYRLKQIDIDGRAKYSAVVLLKGDKSGVLTLDGIYPNPVQTVANIRLQASAQGGNITLQLSDLQGRIVRTKSVAVAAGSATSVTMELQGLAAGQYHLVAVDAQGGVSEVITVVKQ